MDANLDRHIMVNMAYVSFQMIKDDFNRNSFPEHVSSDKEKLPNRMCKIYRFKFIILDHCRNTFRIRIVNVLLRVSTPFST